VAAVLELAELLQDHRVTEVHIGRGRVQPELDAERAAQRELARELARGQAVDGVAREELGVGHGFGHGRQC
jgi:hypothetical protein